ncbi:hypothetical protein NQ317_009877 [Molorchus minor]|uniref:G-patch domain-containing protein n=1 Tax=Molorchus minor TaxID=1323400 RepID=A0ABQ9K2T3_9CUCU|nr:hypothetical protein NQ317_009877 [Molorchus minor]
MSKKSDSFQPKITRNDRFAQMSHQEKVIEQKKREIQAKLEAKEKAAKLETNKLKNDSNKSTKSSAGQKEVKNIFSNDGSFLDQFKHLKDAKKFDSKLKSFNKSKDLDKMKTGVNLTNGHLVGVLHLQKATKRHSRFSLEKVPSFEPKIHISTSFRASLTQNFEPQTVSVTPQNVTGQPLLKDIIPTPAISYANVPQPIATVTVSETVITAPPVLLNVPPPQVVQRQISNTLVLTPVTPSQPNILISAPSQNPVLTTVTLQPPLVANNVAVPVASVAPALPVPPPCLPTVELASIPPPNPIQIQNIPQPEPINTLNIPHPAPIQVQNIPTPNSIQLNEIPNPKPLDLMAIPTPNEDQNMSDPDFIKNIPPPNKSIPPPQISENQTLNTMPCLSSNILQQSQPTTQNINTNIAISSMQSILVHNIPPPSQLQTIQSSVPNQILHTQPNFSSITVALPVGVVVSTAPTPTNAIPSLMAQPILPPPGMGVNVNMNCPPPVLPMNTTGSCIQSPTTVFVSQPPPMVPQMPPLNVPPPSNLQILNVSSGLKDINIERTPPWQSSLSLYGASLVTCCEVFPPGSPDYEAMASLGRMVAECGQGFEDVVRQRKKPRSQSVIYNDDGHVFVNKIGGWFLFHKESNVYRQYQSLVEQFKKEIEEKKFGMKEIKIKPEEMYEPEMALEDNEMSLNSELKQEVQDDLKYEEPEKKRKRRSRWGDKDANVTPPVVMYNASIPNPPVPIVPQTCPIMLSKVTRTDPGLIQYAINTYGSVNLTEEEWEKAEDHYKINLLYQDMVKKREELERLQAQGKNKYDYDSDEETEGGTWEHRLREKEMTATQLWAQELNRQAEGKHHIGDFLPPEELKRFMEKSTAVKEGRQPNFSDYKEFKIKEDNIGFKMLQKLGWSEGEGLGSGGTGIVEPINKAAPREHTQGLGLNQTEEDEDEYESYRKRMMLAYRFRPNPLNNPRRPYY